MSTGYTAYLQKGSKRINLGAAPYALGLDFVPPSITETPNIASGTSANQYGGSKLISKKVESSWYTFSVRVLGTTSNPDNGGAIEGNIKRLDSFLRSGTTAEPVYFCWKENNNVSFEPTIGWWGSTFRAEIITGDAKKSMSFYFGSDLRERGVFADLSLLINPPEWPRRLLASATGGIIEDTLGTADGSSRGIMLPKATTNKATNPVFGHGTPLDDWTTAAGLVSAVNTDKTFVLFGNNSAKVTRIGSSNLQFYQSLNVGNTNAHAFSIYAKKEDGSAITTSDINLYYNTTLTTAFQSIGDGWYRLTATANGIASATTSGVIISRAAQTIYLDGFQVEERTYTSSICYGDMLGCAWTGTAHESTSSRGASSLATTTLPNLSEGTITVSWKPSVANTFGADMRFFQNGATSFRALFQASDDKIYFLDNTNTAGSTDAQTFAAGDDIELAFTWHPTGGLKIYRAGVQIGSNATYTPPTLGATMYWGSTQVPDENIVGTVRGWTMLPRAMTAAEVLADYTARASAASADLRIDWLTYLWTKDGDNVFDQYTLSTTHADWGIVGSVPGSLPCKVTANIVKSAGADAIWIGVNGWHTFINPGDGFADWNGTALAGAVSGEVKQKTVDTTEDYLPGTSGDYISISDEGYKRGIENKPVWAFLSLKDLGSTGLKVKFRHRVYGGGGIADTDWLTLVATAGLTQYMFGPIIIPQYPGDDIATMTNTALFAFRCIRPSGSDTVQTDFFRLIHGRMTKLQPATGTATIRFYYDTDRAYGVDTGPGYTEIIYPEFDDLMFDPNVLNHVVVVSGDQGGSTAITVTVTFTSLYIAPRWALA